MRSRHFNFALAIVISLIAHLLLWPAAKRIKLSRLATAMDVRTGEITIDLTDKPEPKKEPPKLKPRAVAKPPAKKSPEVEPPDEMGESTGKGTGAQAARGDKPLRAPEADQDQAFLSRDPVGMGRVGDPPTFWTGPRGEDGSGGQLGSAQSSPNPAHSPSAQPSMPNHSKDSVSPPQPRQPRRSVVRGPEPQVPPINPSKDVAPPPAKTAMIGAAKPDVKRPPVDEVKAAGPSAQVTSTAGAEMKLPSVQGAPTPAGPASSTAPPAKPDAALDRAAVAMAPQVQAPVAAVAIPPAPAVEVELPKVQQKQEMPATAPPKVTPANPQAPAASAPAILTTGDARAPGRDRASADPAQESDSESDPFSKTAVADALHDGRLEVRHGRKVKTTRPHFLPGSEAAFYANPNATLVLKIAIDETGKVTSADVIRSSGSVEIDQPCRVAVYDWWFEPTHNKAGKPVADVVVFTIHFR